jgi:hypothetical protein
MVPNSQVNNFQSRSLIVSGCLDLADRARVPRFIPTVTGVIGDDDGLRLGGTSVFIVGIVAEGMLGYGLFTLADASVDVDETEAEAEARVKTSADKRTVQATTIDRLD